MRSDARATLLRLARAAIRDRLVGDGSLDGLLAGLTPAEELAERRGVFVTLRRRASGPPGSELRGCIGCVESERPLYEGVIDLAPRAAFADPRFPPVSVAELDGLRFEISALSPLRPVGGPDAIVVGRDGVQLRAGEARSVFLPQVAAERSWTARRLLEQLALKAGLDEDGWRGAQLQTFEADVFAEGEA